MKLGPVLAGLVLAIASWLFVPNPARADYAVLRSGGRLHVTGYALEGDQVRLSVPGGTIQIATSDLIAVEPEDIFPAPPPMEVDFGVRYANLIHAAAQKHGVHEKLISNVIAAESNFDSRAVSRKHALGLMQLLPKTATQYAVTNVFDPAQNIEAGTHYLKDLLDRYRGNVPLALAAYNAGPEMVDRYGGVPPFPETRNYVRQITSALASVQTRAESAQGPSKN
jgi:transglycosylase-like protein with SLT domain